MNRTNEYAETMVFWEKTMWENIERSKHLNNKTEQQREAY